MRHAAYAGILLCLLISVSCARGASTNPASPRLPDLTDDQPRQTETTAPGHYLLGYFSVSIDPVAGTVETVPQRSSAWHLNAVKFVEPPSGGSCLSFSNLEIEGRRVNVDVGLHHPFAGLTQYSGFDVKGIVIGRADMIDPTNSDRKWAGGPDGLRLLNADGWTRWWNPMEFENNGTVFSYSDGMFGTANTDDSHYNATLCGYKVFAAALGPYDDLTHLLSYPLDDPRGRAVFQVSTQAKRHYELVFPADDHGEPDLVFNYAIDACHGLPPDYLPGQHMQVPDDFPPDANQPEPFIVDVLLPTNTSYLSQDGCVGGTLELSIRVSDWQALLADIPVNRQIESIEITSPSLFVGTRTPSMSSDWTPDKPWATYTLLLEGVSPDSVLDQQVLVTIVSSEGDYQPDISSWSGTAPLSSYYVARVPISSTAPIDGSGFAINPLALWPKPGGSIYNNNRANIVGPGDPHQLWEAYELAHDFMPVVDPDGRTYVVREIDEDLLELVSLDPDGRVVSDLDFPSFEPKGNPMLVGCSLLWNNSFGEVMRVRQDGSSELFFRPMPGRGPFFFGMLNIDEDGHAFVHGPSSIQAFNHNGTYLWGRYGIDGIASMFIGPPTVTRDGLVVVGKVDIDEPPPSNFEFWALDPDNGEIIWAHSPEIQDQSISCCAADPLTGKICYAMRNKIVALNPDGDEMWTYEGANLFLPELAIAPDGTIYAAESVLGQTGGTSRLVAINREGDYMWDVECAGGISAGPVVDSVGNAYFASDEGDVLSVAPDGVERWTFRLSGRPEYLAFGAHYSLLVMVRESLFRSSLICLGDE
jgi:hypothetical protein